MDVASVLKPFDLHTEFTFVACHVLKEYVSHDGIEIALSYLFLVIHEIDLKHSLVALSHLHIPDEYILYDTAAA